MHRRIFTNLGATVAMALGLATVPAVADAGLLGERYVAVGYDYAFIESAAYDDGDGLTLFYNHPLSDTIDLGGSYHYVAYGDADGRDEVGDFSDSRVQLHATAYGLSNIEPIWVRLGAGIGAVEHGDDDETNFAWSALIGTEYTLGESAVLHPYLGWTDVLEDSEGTRFVYGVQTVVGVSDKIGLNVRLQGDHHYNFTLSLGALVRF